MNEKINNANTNTFRKGDLEFSEDSLSLSLSIHTHTLTQFLKD